MSVRGRRKARGKEATERWRRGIQSVVWRDFVAVSVSPIRITDCKSVPQFKKAEGEWREAREQWRLPRRGETVRERDRFLTGAVL